MLQTEVNTVKIYYGKSDIKAPPSEHTANLVSTGLCRCEENDMLTLRSEGRVDWSLFYCERGLVDFNGTHILPGEMWIYPPAVIQRYAIYLRDRSVYHYLHFNGKQIEKLFCELHIPIQEPICYVKEDLTDVFHKLSLNAEENSALSRLRAEYLILYLLSKLAKPAEQEKNFGVMKRITDHMEHTFAAPYQADKYADMLHISVSRFNHLFKETVGISPYTYYLNIRLNNAQGLLEQSDLKIHEIAKSCGFKDALYFTQAFKKHTGFTPTTYRKAKKL